MELNNTFTVNLPIEETWKVLQDLERVAHCVPGAAILDVSGDDYHGAVKIKVGPVSTQYKGIVRFVEKDAAAHRAVIRAEGSDIGGQGNANADIVATLTEHGQGTKVEVVTDLALSGRVAQFGRGVIADVSNKILGQFVKNLEADISGSPSNGQPRVPATKPTSLDDIEPLDVMGSMGSIIAKYAVPSVIALVGIIAAIVMISRSGRGKRLPPGALGVPAQGWAQPGGSPVVVNFLLPGQGFVGSIPSPGPSPIRPDFTDRSGV
jgi:carbon monoxide dehydrogenase subunit G